MSPERMSPECMSPEQLAQEQLDAYNERNLERFIACYSDDVRLYRPPSSEPFIAGKAQLAEHYAAKRFNLPGLHAELLGRLVVGNKVFDHERVYGVQGVQAEPLEVAAVYEVQGGLIAAGYFFNAE
jgi:hypothetical protein